MVTMMHRALQFLFVVCAMVLLPLTAFAVDTSVSVTIDSDAAGEWMLIPGQITIIHDESAEVDVSGFRLGSIPLLVHFVGNSFQSSVSIINGLRSESKLLISTYAFEIEGGKAGMYTFPELSAVVGGQHHVSEAFIYEISRAIASANFKLEASVAGRTPLYPGQKVNFVYRIFFIENVDLTSQHLPLLEAEGFKKLGDQKITGYRSGDYTIQEYQQEVEAIKPGVFTFGPSVLEGFAYTEDFFGKRTRKNQRLRAEVEPLKVEVLPFPEDGRPRSFTGAIGEYELKVNMRTPEEICLGDKIELQLVIMGKGEISTVRLPDISQQEGFKKLFRLSDLPPVGRELSNSKVFEVELRPLSSELVEIPAIEFSYFNPISRCYYRSFSDPLPINVLPLKEVPELASQVESSVLAEKKEDPLPLIEIRSNYVLEDRDLHSKKRFRGLPFVVTALGVAALLLQLFIKSRLKMQKKMSSKMTSNQIWAQALQCKDNPLEFIPLVERTFLTALKEQGLCDEVINSYHGLNGENKKQAMVLSFFQRWEEKRFSKRKKIDQAELLEKIQILLDKVQKRKM